MIIGVFGGKIHPKKFAFVFVEWSGPRERKVWRGRRTGEWGNGWMF